MSTNYSSVNETVNDDSVTYKPATTSAATHTLPSGTTGEQWDNAKIIAIAGLAAGGLAALGAILGERKNQPQSKSDRAREILEEAADRARKEAGLVDKDTKKKQKKAKKQSEDAQEQLQRLMADFRGQSEDRADQAKSTASDIASKLAESLSKAKEQVASTYDEKAPQVADTVESMKDTATEKASEYSSKAKDASGTARDNAGSLMDAIKDKLVEAEEEYVEKLAIPKLKEMGAGAVAAMLVGKEKSGELKEKAQDDLIPQAKDQAGKAKETMAKTLGTVVENAQPMAAEAQEKISDVASTAQHKAGEAGDAVKRGTKETRSLLMWVALALTLAFTVFLDEEQQKKVKSVLNDVLGEAKNMYADQQNNSSTF